MITRFEETRVYQIFLQDGKRIDSPSATVDGLHQGGGLSVDVCAKTANSQRPDWAVGNNIWEAHMEVLQRPKVLAMSIDLDVSIFEAQTYGPLPQFHEDKTWPPTRANNSCQHRADNLWLDGTYPSRGREGSPGLALGDCPVEGLEPQDALWENARAYVTYLSPQSENICLWLRTSSTVTWSNLRFGPIGSTVKM